MPSTDSKSQSRLPFFIAAIASIIAIVAVGFSFYLEIQKSVKHDVGRNDELSYRMSGLASPIVNKLGDAYTDANHNLVADPPSDVSKQLDPSELVISYLATENPAQFRDAFKDLDDHIAKATGKTVRYEMIDDTDKELKELRDGQLQIAAFSTGTVPLAVDACGFVPICRAGGGAENGVDDGYHMLIIVPADSPMQKLADLKGQELGVTQPNSNSGYKAALVLLSREVGLLAGKDFKLRFSGGQDTSIKYIKDKTFQAAAVASDVLDRATADGHIKRSDYRILYTSELFPPAAIGYAYNLKPELAEKIKAALLDFNWSGSSLEQVFSASGSTKFVPINYKNDWALVRRIDDAIGTAHVLKE